MISGTYNNATRERFRKRQSEQEAQRATRHEREYRERLEALTGKKLVRGLNVKLYDRTVAINGEA